MHNDTAWMIYQYQRHMKEAQGLATRTIDARLRHIWAFTGTLGETPLNRVSLDEIASFKSKLREPDCDSSGNGTGAPLAPKTFVQICHDLRLFFEWLLKQPGYGSVRRDLSDYFRPDRRHVALAHAKNEKRVPTADELRTLLQSMPTSTLRHRRDRAVIAFFFLTGVRISALISLSLKHVDIDRKIVIQDARDVNTKFSKTMHTTWFPVGEDIAEIVCSWVRERIEAGAGLEEPLFPSTPSAVSKTPANTAPAFWSSPGPVRKIVRQATAHAGIEYFNPHAIRSTLAQMFYEMAPSYEDIKALSQNLGHEDMRTTFECYGTLSDERQHERIKGLWERRDQEDDDELITLSRSASPAKRAAIKALLMS